MLMTRIRELREARGWTLSELAGRAGISVSYLSEIEQHRKPVNSRRLKRFATAFGVAPHDLFALLADPGEHNEVSELLMYFTNLSPEDRALIFQLAERLHRDSAEK